jgi:hypothetical protein
MKMRRRATRSGVASLELVLATGVSMAITAVAFYLGVDACKGLFQVIGHLVGWPHL